MREVILCLLAVAFLSGSCKKGDGCPYSETNITASAAEEQTITNYLSGNGLTATRHSSGMYYSIVQPGSGATAGLCSNLLVNYSGKLANGSVFDQKNDAMFVLGAVIAGWQKGIPLIHKGGQIRLYIPPSLGYGSADVKNGSTVVIPANSMLIFDVTLKDLN